MARALRTPHVEMLWRGFAGSARLGWEVSSNWTEPLLFVIYSVVRPISAALILVVMYRAISGDRGATSYIAFLVIGTAFWSFVQNGLAGFANGIAEDRGRYRMLKYVYTSPQPFPVYLLGRAAAQLGSAAASVVVVLLFAGVLLGLPINPLRVNYPMLIVACLLAFLAVASVAMGYSLSLLATRDSYGYGEIGAQALYVISGAIFPISVLPGPLAAVAGLSPLAYWLELVRRALLGNATVRMYPALSDGAVLLRLGLSSAVAVFLAWLLFRWADRRARRKGYIDLETAF